MVSEEDMEADLEFVGKASVPEFVAVLMDVLGEEEGCTEEEAEGMVVVIGNQDSLQKSDSIYCLKLNVRISVSLPIINKE